VAAREACSAAVNRYRLVAVRVNRVLLVFRQRRRPSESVLTQGVSGAAMSHAGGSVELLMWTGLFRGAPPPGAAQHVFNFGRGHLRSAAPAGPRLGACPVDTLGGHRHRLVAGALVDRPGLTAGAPLTLRAGTGAPKRRGARPPGGPASTSWRFAGIVIHADLPRDHPDGGGSPLSLFDQLASSDEARAAPDPSSHSGLAATRARGGWAARPGAAERPSRGPGQREDRACRSRSWGSQLYAAPATCAASLPRHRWDAGVPEADPGARAAGDNRR